ncbi:protein of unknown function [Kyrpidia spormannii]|uniref:Uncharacterized protein n=1 Tax=Kyrpidia spormannii TaxID=2055160 RepID=A0A6F9E4G9_9BACL|nr:protein of unknown function [Kyrpidia spormannii]
MPWPSSWFLMKFYWNGVDHWTLVSHFIDHLFAVPMNCRMVQCDIPHGPIVHSRLEI